MKSWPELHLLSEGEYGPESCFGIGVVKTSNASDVPFRLPIMLCSIF